jgi:hypothetical protein
MILITDKLSKRRVSGKTLVGKQKRRLTAAEKAKKRLGRRRKEYMTVFINGKQKRVKRPPSVEGMDIDEFIRRNADPIWLHQNETWEYMDNIVEECQ